MTDTADRILQLRNPGLLVLLHFFPSLSSSDTFSISFAILVSIPIFIHVHHYFVLPSFFPRLSSSDTFCISLTILVSIPIFLFFIVISFLFLFFTLSQTLLFLLYFLPFLIHISFPSSHCPLLAFSCFQKCLLWFSSFSLPTFLIHFFYPFTFTPVLYILPPLLSLIIFSCFLFLFWGNIRIVANSACYLLYVCPSTHMYHRSSLCTYFREIYYWGLLSKSVEGSEFD